MFERTYTVREQRDQLEMELAEAIDTLIDAEEELKAKQEYIEALEAQVEMLEEEVPTPCKRPSTTGGSLR